MSAADKVELSPRCQDRPSSIRVPQNPVSANMAEDEMEARAATLASQALDLVASGRDEVRCCPYDICYSR